VVRALAAEELLMELATNNHDVNLLGWWLLAEESHDPIGPVSTDVLVGWLRAGRVPSGALVCEVGRREWQPLDETAPFAGRFRGPRTRLVPLSEQCLVDLEPLPAATEPDGASAQMGAPERKSEP
jgi:hypothetical protein